MFPTVLTSTVSHFGKVLGPPPVVPFLGDVDVPDYTIGLTVVTLFLSFYLSLFEGHGVVPYYTFLPYFVKTKNPYTRT